MLLMVGNSKLIFFHIVAVLLCLALQLPLGSKQGGRVLLAQGDTQSPTEEPGAAQQPVLAPLAAGRQSARLVSIRHLAELTHTHRILITSSFLMAPFCLQNHLDGQQKSASNHAHCHMAPTSSVFASWAVSSHLGWSQPFL